METVLFKKISVEIPEEFECVEGGVCKHFFGSTQVDYAFHPETADSAIGVIYTDMALKNDIVKDRIIEYQQYYSRMVPGFKMGEMRINDQTGRNVAFFSYKSNAPKIDLYNMLAITTLEDRELIDSNGRDITDCFAYKTGSPLLPSTELNIPAIISIQAME